MNALFAIALLFAATQSVPGIDDLREPYLGPITKDTCIEIYWHEKRPDGTSWALMNVPLKEETVIALDQVRREGKAVLVKCDLSPS